jgi:hypothetical protein
VEGVYLGYMGDAAHDAARRWLGQVYKLDLVEGVDAPARLALYPKRVGVERTCEEGRIHATVEGIEFHMRPDGVIVGDENGYWDIADWRLLEIKSTTKWGIMKARKSRVWYPAYVDQAQISMHILGLNECFLLQTERDNVNFIGDDLQVASMGGGWGQVNWPRIKYDPRRAKQILEKCREILTRIDQNLGPPDVACERGTFEFNRCVFNDQMVYGTRSGPQCPGGGKKSEAQTGN